MWHPHDLIGIAKSRLGADRFAVIVTDEVPANDPFGHYVRQAFARLWPSFADAITSHTGHQ